MYTVDTIIIYNVNTLGFTVTLVTEQTSHIQFTNSWGI